MYGIIPNNTFDTKISNFSLLMVNLLFYNVSISQLYLIFLGFHNLLELDITTQQKNTYLNVTKAILCIVKNGTG